MLIRTLVGLLTLTLSACATALPGDCEKIDPAKWHINYLPVDKYFEKCPKTSAGCVTNGSAYVLITPRTNQMYYVAKHEVCHLLGWTEDHSTDFNPPCTDLESCSFKVKEAAK